jgi:hypothetical protein
MYDVIQEQANDLEQEVDVILNRHNENFDNGCQSIKAIVAMRVLRPNPNRVVWYHKHESVPDGKYYLPRHCDFISLHDIMPITPRVSSAVDQHKNALSLHLYTGLDKDVSSVIAAYAQSPIGHVTIISTGREVFSEPVFSFPHTGTFASVIPRFLARCSEICVTVTTSDGLCTIPFEANIKQVYVDESHRNYLYDQMNLEVKGYNLIIKREMLLNKFQEMVRNSLS